MTCGIYKIENKDTGEVYIGQSVNIERRWIEHRNTNFDTSEKMLPLMQLNEQNPESVGWSIIREIPNGVYNDDELKFVLSVYEQYELECHGGLQSDKILNIQNVGIPAVPPSILRGSRIPDFVKLEVVFTAIGKWYDKTQKEINWIKRERESFEGRYKEMLVDNAVLSNNVRLLNNQIESLKESQHTIRENMAADYEVFKLKKEIQKLQDEKEELAQRVSFWKEKCEYWRELYSER